MSAYRLTRRVNIMRRAEPVSDFEPDDGRGQVVLSTWAEVRQMRDAERYYADQVTAGANYRITLRWPGIMIYPSDWVEVDGMRFDIDGMKDPTGSGLYVELTCAMASEGIGGNTFR